MLFHVGMHFLAKRFVLFPMTTVSKSLELVHAHKAVLLCSVLGYFKIKTVQFTSFLLRPITFKGVITGGICKKVTALYFPATVIVLEPNFDLGIGNWKHRILAQ